MALENLAVVQEVIDLLPLGACVISPELEIFAWNGLVEDWTGIPRDKALRTEVIESRDHCIACGEICPGARHCPECGTRKPVDFACRGGGSTMPMPVHLFDDELSLDSLHCTACGELVEGGQQVS